MHYRLSTCVDFDPLSTHNSNLVSFPLYRQVHGKSKMKKAFCEPGNISFCPPITLAATFSLGEGNEGSFLVHRSAENGGDRLYETSSELEKEFADGTLHPGDLKAATTALMFGILEKVAAGIKVDAEALKASKTMKAFQKKMAKSQK
jgi:tyrosyl-tRNA synthetase